MEQLSGGPIVVTTLNYIRSRGWSSCLAAKRLLLILVGQMVATMLMQED